VAVPDFQSLLLPLLRLAGDCLQHSLAEAREWLAKELKLSLNDQEELLPSGRQTKFANRVAWAKVYLQQAGLLLSPKRGHFLISDRGRNALRPRLRASTSSSWSSMPNSCSSELQSPAPMILRPDSDYFEEG
jgi:restriction endonuclease Mrr